VQLIRIDDRGKCHLQPEAAGILGLIEGRLAVVGIAGLYRTGKSFLLNRLLGLQSGFEIGPSVNPCTKGIWMWGQPVELAADYFCIFIDTEGLGSTLRTASCDMQIFSLCVLLSSLFIYNSMGAIDEMAIEDLHLVLHLSQHIHVRSGAGGQSSAAELAEFLPSFLWVLRDFHLRLTDGHGQSITATEYLENALRPRDGQEKQNKLRGAVRELFRERQCVTMVRPCEEEEDLRHIQRLSFEALRPKFQAQVEDFTRKVYLSMRPKRIEGSTVTGPALVHLASEYCKAINNSAVPAIKSAWSYAVQSQLRACLKEAVQVYRAQMNDRAMEHLPMAEDALRELHRDSKARALEVFQGASFAEDDPHFREYRAELARRIKQLYDHVKGENASTSQQQCEACAEELYRRHIERKLNLKGSYESVEQLMRDWEQVRQLYLERTAGPAQADVMSTLLFQKMTESVNRLCDQKKLDERRICAFSTLWSGATLWDGAASIFGGGSQPQAPAREDSPDGWGRER